MAEQILYFKEYKGKDEFGYTVHPYFGSSGWCMNGKTYTLEDIGKRCNIPRDELLILKLKYGAQGIHRRV